MNYNNGNYGNMPFSYQTPYYGNMYGQGQQYVRQQPMQQTQVVQPQQAPMQYEMPIQYVGYATLKEAEAYILMPNAKAIFIDKANGMYYEKTSNNDGQSFIKHFKEVAIGENQAKESDKPQATIDYSIFAKKEDLGAFVSVDDYGKLLQKVQQLEKQIGGKSNNGKHNQQ